MAAGRIQPVLNALTEEFDRATDLVADVRALRRPAPITRGHPGLPEFQLNLISELAFLRCVLAWEVFLEESFLVYLTGGKGLSGKATKRYVTPTTSPQARALLSGESRYLSWNTNDDVIKRAKIWFKDGEPYTSALGALGIHSEIRTVRNRIAHNSGEAKTKFNKLRAAKKRKADPAQHGMGPGAFLARPASASTTMTRFERYLTDLRLAANAISQN
jgi:hypothetical protein